MTTLKSTSAPRDPYLVYLDTTTLVDWLLPTESRHPEAKALVEVFHRYQAPTYQIQAWTSQWALTEAHSVLYKKALEKKLGIRVRDLDSRKYFPPDVACLQEASITLAKLQVDLPQVIYFRVDRPDYEVWDITYELARQTGIYPADSLHIATAIRWGCSMLVSTDKDLLNKIIYHRTTVIEQLLRGAFRASTPPPFEACPLKSVGLRKLIPFAQMRLKQLGYV